jgi:hypothetical protein
MNLDIRMIDDALAKGVKGPGRTNEFTILAAGKEIQAEVKLMNGIGVQAAFTLTEATFQVGRGGVIFAVRQSDSAFTTAQFQKFIDGYKPKLPGVRIILMNESSLPKVSGR